MITTKFKKVSFPNDQGALLHGQIDLPLQQDLNVWAVFAHCFTCSSDLKVVEIITRSLTAYGISVLKFDFTGLGSSQGDFSDTTFSSNLDDLITAAEFLKKEFGTGPQLLVGHSLGGAAVLHAAPKIASIKAVATIGAPSSPDHVTHLLEGGMKELEHNETAKVNIGGRPFNIKKQLIDDLKRSSENRNLRDLNKALLVLHSPQDDIVGIENAAEIYQSAKHPKSFITIDGANHLLSNRKDAAYAGKMIGAWAERYINNETKSISRPEEGFVKARIGTEKYLTEILNQDHFMTADEPTSVGGGNLGPNPYEFLLGGLGACTAMTLRMYADRKKIPLSQVNVDLKIEKVHANDCEDCDSAQNKIDKITRRISIEGDLTNEQRARLIEIADKCPVHKTLNGSVIIETKAI
ncbi:MAG: alpha/beta fold hydrolase [Cyclobacteriaceae bacterium]